jgi:membrane AbrB-like protein
MPSAPKPRRAAWFEAMPLAGQCGLLLAGSLLLAVLLTVARLPAALLLGPMIAAIVLGSNGARLSVPRRAVFACQTIVGCLIARSITGDIVHAFLRDWPLLLATVLAIIATSGVLGWLISRWQVLPGSTAVWGSAPGGASVMMIMAGAFGADARLVAFMQYLRVVLVAAVASLVARFWVGQAGPSAALGWGSALHWGDLATLDWGGFLATVLIAAGGGAIGMALRIPAGTLLVPMVIAAVLEAMGLVIIVLPQWLLAITYAFLGWSIGLSFNREILQHAARALLPIMLAIGVMIGVCAALAALLVRYAGIDPLTAYLATSPGGMDSVAIIGAASKADLSFVMALQVVRLVIVLIVGPPLARFIAQRL